jgi:hypothetical protein
MFDHLGTFHALNRSVLCVSVAQDHLHALATRELLNTLDVSTGNSEAGNGSIPREGSRASGPLVEAAHFSIVKSEPALLSEQVLMPPF